MEQYLIKDKRSRDALKVARIYADGSVELLTKYIKEIAR